MNYFTKKLITKITLSLFAGVATAIGAKATEAIWDKVVEEKPRKETDKSYA